MSGLCPPETYELLSTLAATVQAGDCIVESGTFKGHGTRALAAGASRGVPVYTVDTHDLDGTRYSTAVGPRRERIDFTSPLIRREAERRIGNRATMIRDYSENVGRSWDKEPVGLLVVDADHRQGALRREFAAWEPHISHGGMVCFDDYHPVRYPGVVAVVSALLTKGVVTHLEQHGTMAVVIRS